MRLPWPKKLSVASGRMVWTYTFRVEATVDRFYEQVFDPQRWFSFDPGYRGLDEADDHWPDVGSTIVVRYSVFPGTALRLRQRVVAHTQGVEIEMDEEALGGLWQDHPRISFEPEGEATNVTLTVDSTSRFRAARPVIALMGRGFDRMVPKLTRAMADLAEA